MFTCLQTDNNGDGFKYGTVSKAFVMKMKVFVLVIVCSVSNLGLVSDWYIVS